jgi:hypothetical protein
MSGSRPFRGASFVSLVVTSLLTAACSVLPGRDRSEHYEFAVSDVRLTVEAVHDRGTVVASPAGGQAPNVAGITPLSAPVHLEVKDGTLKSATVRFQVTPAALSRLPAGLRDVSAAFDVMTRSPETGGRWVWAGPGAYDPETHMLNAEVTHFSDWAYGVPDYQALGDRVGRSTSAKSAGTRLGEVIWGEPAQLACPSDQIALLYFLRSKDPRVPLPINACLSFAPATQIYHLELVNKTSLPFRITMPVGLHVVPDALTGRGAMFDAFAASNYVWSGKPVLQPEGKVVLTGKYDEVQRGDQLTLDFDGGAYVGDMASYTTDLLFGSASDQELMSRQLQDVVNGKEFADCVTKHGDEFEEVLRGRQERQSVAEYVLTTQETCYQETTAKLLEKVAEKAGRSSAVAKLAKGLNKRLAIIFDTPDLMKSFREEMDGLITIASKQAGWIDDAGATVTLMPTPPIQNLNLALPPPPGTTDDREVIPIGRNLLLPDSPNGTATTENCGPYDDLVWFEHPPADPDATAVAVGGGYGDGPVTYSAWLVHINRDYTGPAHAYVENLTRTSCNGHNQGYGSPPTTYTFLASDVGGDASRAFLTKTAGATDGYLVITVSGEYLMLIQFGFDGGAGARPDDLGRARRLLEPFYQHVNRFLGTDF